MPALLDLRKPGVYTQEISTLPPSISATQTAVPVFIGYTEKADKDGMDVTRIPVRIKSPEDYVRYFGDAMEEEFTIDIDETDQGLKVAVSGAPENKFRMAYAVKMYFQNGGGPCFIVSVGNYRDAINANAMQQGLDALKKSRDVTMILFPDAVGNLSNAQFGSLMNLAMQHCSDMKNRVLLIDVITDEHDDDERLTDYFRNKMSSDIDLKKYGIAYYPFLQTLLPYRYSESSVRVGLYKKKGVVQGTSAELAAVNTAIATLKSDLSALENARQDRDLAVSQLAFITSLKNALTPGPGGATVGSLKTIAERMAADAGMQIPTHLTTEFANTTATVTTVQTAVATDETDYNTVGTGVVAMKEAAFSTLTTTVGTAKTNLQAALTPLQTAGNLSGSDLAYIKSKNDAAYNKMMEAITNLGSVQPPTPAVAGVYVRNDVTKGVWNTPANTSLNAVISPLVHIDDDFHASLNVDGLAGKSINAIRPYTGKGILIMGGRTLAGNNLEWRYVSVRRTFCFIEDSVGRAMEDFVFAPNNRETWLRVKGGINNFLNEIWKAGGLFGNTPDEAYQVSVGVPETMSEVDLLEGRMVIVLKLAVVRPAEFIILRYEHKFNTETN